MKSFSAYTFSGTKELDLRDELNNFMFGASGEIARGSLYVLRRMRPQDGISYPVNSSELQICSCKSSNYSNEVNKDYPCDICEGEGYLFDDEVIVARKTDRFEYQSVEKYNPWGKNIVEWSFFYVEYHEDITRYDKILEPLIDTEGQIITPVKILHRHNIHMAERFRGDYGRTSYWRLSCFTD